MISTLSELESTIKVEREIYESFFAISTLKKKLSNDIGIKVFKYVKRLRIMEYYHCKNDIFSKLIFLFCKRSNNRLGLSLGIELSDGVFDIGLLIYHPNGIVVNSASKIGKNCKLHGNNCIGNNGKDNLCPIIGDGVDIGVGAKIIGNVTIANNVTIGAGAVVVNDILESGAIVVGIPAKVVRKMT